MVNLKENYSSEELAIRLGRNIKSYKPKASTIDSAKRLKYILFHAKKTVVRKGGYFSNVPRNIMQLSMAKTSYTSNNYKKQWESHGRYLQREGAQKEQEKGIGFDEKNENINIADKLNQWQEAGDPRFWKVIISPDLGHKIDLKTHVKELMKQVERDFSTKLEWVAIDHYNTTQHHAHIVIRGRDKAGKDFEIDPSYIKNGFRLRSREVATKEIGHRLERDVLEKRERVIEAKHITEIDRDINKQLDKNSIIRLNDNIIDLMKGQKQRQVISRLGFLESIGFAKKIDSFAWVVTEDFLNGLKAHQKSQDIIKARSENWHHIKDKNIPLVHTKLEKGEKIIGRIVGFGIADEHTDKKYILIEGIDSKMHYLSFNARIMRERDNAEVKVGEYVYLEKKSFKDKQKNQEIEYVYSKTYKDLKEIVKEERITEVDKYLLDIVNKSEERQFDIGKSISKTRKDFFIFLDERIRTLRRYKMLDKELNIIRRERDRGFDREIER